MHCLLCCSESVGAVSTEEGRPYFRCTHCGFLWLAEGLRLAREEEKKRYLLHDNSWEIPEYREYLSRLALPVSSYLRAGDRGIDYGAGPVQGMRLLMEPWGFKVDSYDPFFFPDLPKNSYDFLLCNEAAEHFYEPLREFERMNEVLRPGAVLGFSSNLLPHLADFCRWSYRRDPTHCSFYGEETVAWLAHRFGWKVLLLQSPLWILRKS